MVRRCLLCDFYHINPCISSIRTGHYWSRIACPFRKVRKTGCYTWHPRMLPANRARPWVQRRSVGNDCDFCSGDARVRDSLAYPYEYEVVDRGTREDRDSWSITSEVDPAGRKGYGAPSLFRATSILGFVYLITSFYPGCSFGSIEDHKLLPGIIGGDIGTFS